MPKERRGNERNSPCILMNKTRTQLLEQVLNHLGYISRSISAPHGFSFGDLVLTKPQITIFFFVGHHRDGVSVKDIAKFLNVTKGAVTQFIDTLVEKNLVIGGCNASRLPSLQKADLTKLNKPIISH